MINNFISIGLSEINNNPKIFDDTFSVSSNDLRDILKNVSVSFILTEVTRLHTLYLCEGKASYTQQSQRYTISNSFDNSIIEKYMTDAELDYISELLNSTYHLYSEMITTRDDVKGRPNRSDYIHSILPQEARYILPLATPTNIQITCGGEDLINMINIMVKHDKIFNSTIMELIPYLGRIGALIIGVLTREYMNSTNFTPVVTYIEDTVEILDTFDTVQNVSSGAYMSTTTKPLEKIKSTSVEDKVGVINRVNGYNHTSVNEHARFTFGVNMSVISYHQLIRHRHISINRDNLYASFIKTGSNFYVPYSIKNSDFYDRYMKLSEDVLEFIDMLKGKYDKDISNICMLNNFMITANISTNMREEFSIYKERLCLTAEDEIRNVVESLFDLRYTIMPELYKKQLPSCIVTGNCKEKGMTCGMPDVTKQLYNNYL